MKQIKLIPLQQPINKEIILPGCLSYTIRALNIAAMTKGSVKIVNCLKSDDTYAMYNALKTLGIKVEEGNDSFTVHGDITDVKAQKYEIDINISGRTARTLVALLCVVNGEKILTCKEAFKKRPIKDLVDGLRQLGASIEYLETEGHLPIKIMSNQLSPGTVKMKGDVSSQYFSAIMMIAPVVGGVTIEVIGEQASKPFIDITTNIMKSFGVTVINENYQKYKIQAKQQYAKTSSYTIEPDAISASYFWAIAAITKSKIKILNLNPNSPQGDIKFADILGGMGCIIEKSERESWISVQGTGELHGININMNNTPDTVQTLAVVSAFAKGRTHITGLAHLKIKETDRIEAPKEELKKMGINVTSTKDSITINGGKIQGATIETYGDHRMAMAFAVAGAKIARVSIKNPDVINKSFPTFWEKLREIGIKMEERE